MKDLKDLLFVKEISLPDREAKCSYDIPFIIVPQEIWVTKGMTYKNIFNIVQDFRKDNPEYKTLAYKIDKKGKYSSKEDTELEKAWKDLVNKAPRPRQKLKE